LRIESRSSLLLSAVAFALLFRQTEEYKATKQRASTKPQSGLKKELCLVGNCRK